MVGLGVGLILSHNSSQASCDKGKLVPAGVVSLESGTCSLRGEVQLTKVLRGCHHLLRDDKSVLLIFGWAFAFEENKDGMIWESKSMEMCEGDGDDMVCLLCGE